jgi:hypothetical protein
MKNLEEINIYKRYIMEILEALDYMRDEYFNEADNACKCEFNGDNGDNVEQCAYCYSEEILEKYSKYRE